MIRNYFKIAIRNLWKNKGYSAINIFGLAVGLATCLVMSLYVLDELSYDRFYANADRIYRINSDIRMGGANLRLTQTSDMMGPLLKKDYPQVEEYTRIYNNNGGKLIKKDNQFITEQKVAHADSTFFNVFGFKLLKGDPSTALVRPKSIILSEEYARKYFGNEDPMGQRLEVESDTVFYTVTGVIENVPDNSHIKFDMLASLSTYPGAANNNFWVSHNFYTYALVKEGVDKAELEKKLSIK